MGMNEISSLRDLVETAEAQKQTLSQVVLELEAHRTKCESAELLKRMEAHFSVMERSLEDGLRPGLRSQSGLTGGLAEKLKRHSEEHGAFAGDLVAAAMTYALAIAESNACMGRIVAAPTAGSCGILPGVLLALIQTKQVERERAILALFNAAGVGSVIERRATLSGAEGGCQAECGAASAMAASAAVELMGGSPQACSDAAALALKFVMGLVCDPVAGLVEVPCVKRNASGAANALAAAQLALAGIPSAIPADEVIDAMKCVGMMMNYSLKETSKGGIAASPCAKCITKELKAKMETR